MSSTRTSPAVERAVATLLGADGATAVAAIDALVAADRLGEGIALHALLVAARRGTDAAGALRAIAEGAARLGTWSDYEHRVAAEELGDEVRQPRAGTADTVVAAGPDAPLAAVRGLAAGAGTVVADPVPGLAPARAACDRTFVARLTASVGAHLVERDPGGVGPDDAPRDRPPLDETVPRAAAYLDVLDRL